MLIILSHYVAAFLYTKNSDHKSSYKPLQLNIQKRRYLSLILFSQPNPTLPDFPKVEEQSLQLCQCESKFFVAFLLLGKNRPVYW